MFNEAKTVLRRTRNLKRAMMERSHPDKAGRQAPIRGWVGLLVGAFALLMMLWAWVAAVTDARAEETPPPGRVYLPIVFSAAVIGEVPASTDVPTGLTGFEPTIAVVNPRNPSQVAVGRGCTVVISNDFGQTFPIVRNTTLGNCNGDPSLAFDSQGRLFISHLSRSFGANELTVVAAQIADTTTLGNATYTPIQISVTNGNDDDKQWLAADANPSSPFRDNLYLVWTQFTGIGAAAGGPTTVLFSRSTNQGVTWSAPQTLSAAGEGFVWPAHVAVGLNGDVFVAYHTNTCGGAGGGTIPLLVDGFGGQNFAAGVIPQKNNSFAAGQATMTCNVQDSSGDEIAGADFWLQGTMQPWILPDPARAGNVYVVANDDTNNAFASGDDANVVIARSTDNGVTFSVGRVDHGPGQSFAVMPTAHIDQDGNIAVHWYDNRRNLMNTGANANFGAPNFLLDLYGTTSNDGGLTFTNDFRINDNPFDPDAGNPPCRFGSLAGNNCTVRIGEYNGVWTVDGIGYAAWTGNATPPGPPFPSNGAGAQTTFFDLFSMLGAFPDRFEPNESRDFAVVAALGSDDIYNEPRLSIHSATDVDFFKVTALHTGKLEVEIEFNERINNLNVRARDRFGNVVVTGTMTTLRPGSSLAMLATSVVQGEIYFVEVCDRNAAVCNPNAPGTFAPQSTYDLTIINRRAPVPFELDLRASSDTGSDDDDMTSDNTPTIQLRVDDADFLAMGINFSSTNDGNLADDPPGFKVRIIDNGNPAGFATPVAGQPGVYEFTFPAALSEGAHSLTARVVIVDPSNNPITGVMDHFIGQGGESDSLLVTINTTAPVCSPASPPDLLDSSDDAGISIDNVTTIMAPAFKGAAGVNAIVHIRANGEIAGVGQAGPDASDGVPGNGLGAYEITMEPLADGVYQITAVCENEAGVISDPTPALQVTIANRVLNLAGATADVLVNLADGAVSGNPATITGYPGIPGGKVGINGIPMVNLDVNGNTLMILGTPGDDVLVYIPAGPQDGSLTRAGTAQAINFTNVAGVFTLDPAGGSDVVTVNGTILDDTVAVMVGTTATVQVNSRKTVQLPIGSVERLGIASGQGVDAIDVTVFDTVNAILSVDGGEPGVINPIGDVLNVYDGSGRAQMQQRPGGPVPNSGAVFVDYPHTTSAQTRIDYADVEQVRLIR